MQHLARRSRPGIAVVVGLAVACGGQPAQPRPSAAVARACAPSTLSIAGNQIWVHREGSGSPTVVFEAGFGNDSSVWAQIAPRVREAGVQTVVYDRAGMGKSTINVDLPYSIDNDVRILRAALAGCGITGPIVMVGHSYGGGIGLLAASQDRHIQGLVLIDAVVPGAFPDSELAKSLETMRAQYAEIRAQAPELAKVAIPFAEALPEIARRIDAVHLPSDLPVIDIVAEHGSMDAASAQISRDAHARFAASHPRCRPVLAVGSSHKVMADQPELVIAAILEMVEQARRP
jgi:pimeloyl-ACP methyl ester carboxylesterase